MALYDANEMRIIAGSLDLPAPSRYGERRGYRWPTLVAIMGFHVLLGVTLDMAGALPVRRAPSELKMITLSPEMAPPPPVVAAKLSKQVADVRTLTVPQPMAVASLDAPRPIVSVPAVLPAPVVSTAAPAPQPAAVSGPVRVADLDAKAVTVVAPKYPLESRRKREQGTVVLAVTLATDGAVAAVDLAQSSGFDRLDRAALDAVRRWRWSPTLRDGNAVAVTGTVDIPFVLQG